jgi:hypothetical protein
LQISRWWYFLHLKWISNLFPWSILCSLAGACNSFQTEVSILVTGHFHSYIQHIPIWHLYASHWGFLGDTVMDNFLTLWQFYQIFVQFIFSHAWFKASLSNAKWGSGV